jgi:hypothetical protein
MTGALPRTLRRIERRPRSAFIDRNSIHVGGKAQ